MSYLFKKKPGASLFLVFVLSLQFLFLPFFHLHPDDVHGHEGDLSTHKHDGHVHSHELESLVHFLNLHPDEPGSDERQHHSHSSPEHDSDFFEVNLNKTSLYPEKTFKLNKDSADVGVSHSYKPSFVKFLPQKADLKHDHNLPDLPTGRSPPLILL
jgi:hypothetical protein